MLRSAKSSTPSRSNQGASTSNLGANGGSSVFRSNQSIASAESALHHNLGLHSAAATGNVGLVKFALDNGQPHTSILNGLLPLHAACSGGSEPVVRLLLSYGADVNATRVKATKGSGSGPGTGTGTEGSSPLHFACANGHLSIVRLLLENGARPTARDKDRQTPLTLASSQGHATCVSLLKSWIASYGPNGLARPLMSGSSSRSNSYSDQGQNSSPIKSQRSFESLSSAAAGVKASLRNHKKQALAKVNSNPNLKSIASSASSYGSPPLLPPPLPTISRNASENSSTSPQTLSSMPHSLHQDYKRRPSLPSIFERAAHPSSTLQSFLSTNSLQSESIEELDVETKDLNARPTVSPNRTTHRLLGKRSLPGLSGKAVNSNIEGISQVPTIDPKYATQRSGSVVEDSKSSTLPLPVSARARSGSDGMPGQPSSGQLATFDKASTIVLSSSPTSSVDNFDSSTRQIGIPSHSYRPRKSSNLSVTTSNLSPLFAQDTDQGYKDGNLSLEQGRKRSQSATSAPKQVPSATEIESLRKLSLSQQSTTVRERNQSRSDDTKEFLQPASIPTRYRSHRSPLLSSKVLIDEMQSRSSSTTSLGMRQLNTQRSASSLASSSNSSIADQKTSRANSFAGVGIDGGGTVPRVHLETGDGSRSASNVDIAARSNSAMPFGAGMSAREQAQAILRTAEFTSDDVPAVSLTQMLAAYGEALAQERQKASSTTSPIHLRKQGSVASLSSTRLASVAELPVQTYTATAHRNQPGSVTPVSTPPESPQMARSRAESSSTSFSRSPSSHRLQKGKTILGGESLTILIDRVVLANVT